VVWVASSPLQVKLLQLHSYVPLPPVAVKVIAAPTQVLAELLLITGAAGGGSTCTV
jgi:hypothetical protein